MLKIGSAFSGICVGGLGFAAFKSHKQLVQQGNTLQRLFSEIVKYQHDLIECRGEKFDLMCSVIKVENEYKEVQKEIQNNPMFKFKNALFGSAQKDDFELKSFPSDMHISTYHQFLAEPCGWNKIDEVTLTIFMKDYIEPTQILKRNTEFLGKVVNISERVLEIRIREKSKILSPDEFLIFKEHAEMVQKESRPLIEKWVKELQETDRDLYLYVQENGISPTQKASLQKDIADKEWQLVVLGFAITQCAFGLIDNGKKLDEQARNDPPDLKDIKVRRLQNIAEFDVLSAGSIGFSGIGNVLSTHKTILEYPLQEHKKEKKQNTAKE